MSTLQHSKACCTLPPFTGSDYKPIGNVEPLTGTDIEIYTTGKKDSEIALICVYDIFGFMNNTLQGADILANILGARVAMPDFFKGKPWELSKFPPPDGKEFMGWLGQYQWPYVEPILLKTIALLRQDGAKKFGLYGFCWGGKMAVKSTQYVGAAAMIHPAFVEVSDADGVVAPLCVIDSKDEDKDTIDKFVEELKKKPFGDKIVRKRYDNMFHGFCAGRANYGDEENAKEANKAYTDVADFFKANL